MHKRAKFLFSCMIFVANAAIGQKSADQLFSKKDIFNIKPAYQTSGKINISTAFHQPNNKKQEPVKIISNPVFMLNPVSCSVISADFYTQNFGFFCKKELQFEKATKIPFKFRLGSLQYNDYLEGKPNAVNPF